MAAATTTDIPLKVKQKAQRGLTARQRAYVNEILSGQSCFTSYCFAFPGAKTMGRGKIVERIRKLNENPAVSVLIRERNVRVFDERPVPANFQLSQANELAREEQKIWIYARLVDEATSKDNPGATRVKALLGLADLLNVRNQAERREQGSRKASELQSALMGKLQRLVKLRGLSDTPIVDITPVQPIATSAQVTEPAKPEPPSE